jgi:hypothetical protein
MPILSVFFGIIVRMWHDDRPPPHIQVAYQGFETLVEIRRRALLRRKGPLLEPLRDEAYFRRLFIDAGALCWPNGLELAPARLYESCLALDAA